MKKTLKNQGFSLVEVLFAMFFLSVIVFGVIKLQTSNLILTNVQNNEIQAHFISTQALEIAEAIGEASITGSSAPCGSFPCDCNIQNGPPYSVVCPGTAETFGVFNRSIQLDNAGLINAWHVTSEVSWEDNVGAHSVSSKRIIHQ